MKKKKICLLLVGAMLIVGMTGCGKNKLKGEWKITEITYDMGDGEIRPVSNQVFFDSTIAADYTIKFDDETCAIIDPYQENHVIYCDYSTEEAALIFEKDGEAAGYEYKVEGGRLEFTRISGVQEVSPSGTNYTPTSAVIACERVE